MDENTKGVTDLDDETLAETAGEGATDWPGPGTVILAIAYAIGYSVFLASSADLMYVGVSS